MVDVLATNYGAQHREGLLHVFGPIALVVAVVGVALVAYALYLGFHERARRIALGFTLVLGAIALISVSAPQP